jgi:hypothetical protein
MPDRGYYAKRPRPEAVEKLLEYLRGNPVVETAELLSEQLLEVKRKNGPALRVFLTNVYILGEAEALDIVTAQGSLQAIVTMSEWNSYTSDAKIWCKERGVGLFKFREFLGAIYQSKKQKFLDYESPEEIRARRLRTGTR